MYQIKFLKPLTLSKNKQVFSHPKYKLKPSDPVYELSSTLTIANDLGEQFFYGDASLNIAVKAQATKDIKAARAAKIIESSDVTWNSGKRAVDFKILLKLDQIIAGDYISLHISLGAGTKAIDQLNYEKTTIKELKTEIIDESLDIFKGCEDTEEFNLNVVKFYSIFSDLIRVPQLLEELPIKTERISRRPIIDTILFEELSGSIARHLWDAGILMNELSKQSLLKFIDPIRKDDELNILELGTGIGLVSIHLSQLFKNSKVLATDLEDSREICERNITFNEASQQVKFLELDWESEVKTDTTWDLIVVTDCTYNPLYYDALINVLKRETTSDYTKVIISHKFREPISEAEFFTKVHHSEFKLQRQIWHNIGGQTLVHTGLYTL